MSKHFDQSSGILIRKIQTERKWVTMETLRIQYTA